MNICKMCIRDRVKPRFFLPVHGEYRMLYKHAQLAQQLGMPEENTFVLENGEVLEVSRRRCRINGTVTSGRVLIDGLGVGDAVSYTHLFMSDCVIIFAQKHIWKVSC